MNARKAYVTLSAGGSPAQVNGVPHLLEELCVNLCDNAIRYNRPGGRVEVTTGHTPRGQAFPAGGRQRHRHPAGKPEPGV